MQQLSTVQRWRSRRASFNAARRSLRRCTDTGFTAGMSDSSVTLAGMALI
ncbi:MAG TPA: hypothetical protein VGF87_06330 [Acidimicrobiales bacterium]